MKDIKSKNVTKNNLISDWIKLRNLNCLNKKTPFQDRKITKFRMTDDTNAALMYSILPSIGECCKSDPDTARKLREIFVKVEKHAPGFSEDFIGALHKGLSRPQFPYDATLLSLSGQDLKEFKMIKTE